MEEPGIMTGLGAFVAVIGAWLRGEGRTRGLERRMNQHERHISLELATKMPRELCAERVKRIEEGQGRIEAEVAGLKGTVHQGLKDLAKVIREGK